MGSNNIFDGLQKSDSFRSAIKPRCAYFSGFKRFSKNRQKVNEMTPTEATVASGVKNWYINFVSKLLPGRGKCQVVPKQ